MGKPTPGPWSVEDNFIFAENSMRIADTACDDQSDMSAEEMQANARLIANRYNLKLYETDLLRLTGQLIK